MAAPTVLPATPADDPDAPIKLARFYLTFTATAAELEEGKAFEAATRQKAMAHYGDSEVWYDWIYHLMKDTVDDANLEEDLYNEDSLEPKAMYVNVVEDADDPTKFHGEVTWRAAACLPVHIMLENAAWRIDDRMTFYGAEDMDFFVSVYTTRMYKKRVKVLPRGAVVATTEFGSE